MRILHVIPHYFPAVRYGGPIRSVHGLAAATAALGHDVHVYTTNADGKGVLDVPLETAVDRDGVSVWYFPIGMGQRIYRSPRMLGALNANIAGFDIVHIHYVWTWPTLAAAAVARRQQVPYVLAPRGMLVADLIARKNPLAKRLWLSLFDRRNVEAAAAVHVTAESEAADVLALGLKPSHIAVIPNGVELPARAAPGIEDARTTPGADGSEAPYVLFLGRISWKKGLDRLIAALSVIPDVTLIIAGYDEGGHSETVRRLAQEAGVAPRVRFAGPVEGEDKWRLIRGARCLALVSYHENFGIAAVEAMAAGCPVVVSSEVGLADVVRTQGCGLVTSGAPEDIATALCTLIGDNNQRLAMGAAGRRAARDLFGWPAIAGHMQDLYANITEQRKA